MTLQQKIRARDQARRAFPDLGGCEHCSATERLERHHPDLSEPLTVTVLCKTCHVKEHGRTGGWGAKRYRQLADTIRERIVSGEYPPPRIPSIGRIHLETGLAPKTIRRGIRLLADEGWVLIVKGKGTYVAQGEAEGG